MNFFLCRKRFETTSFWESDSPASIRMRLKLFRKARDEENDFTETRQVIRRKLKDAKGKVDLKQAELKKAKFKLLKAKAGFL
jgi:hypothetical protein